MPRITAARAIKAGWAECSVLCRDIKTGRRRAQGKRWRTTVAMDDLIRVYGAPVSGGGAPHPDDVELDILRHENRRMRAAAWAQGGSFALGPDGDDERIAWYSPRVGGLAIGASYTPNATADGDDGNTTDNDEGEFSQFVGAGVNWRGDLGDSAVAFGFGYN